MLGSRVETRRFQAYGSTGFKLHSPTGLARQLLHAVAAQVDPFVKANFETSFSPYIPVVHLI
jgi:hypothetical protein